MYTRKTLRKVTKQLSEKLSRFMGKDFANLKIHVSKGNKKIGKAYNWSLPPVIGCGNCTECKWFCYAVNSAIRYENVRNAWSENLAMMKLDQKKTFDQIEDFLSHRRAHKFFRWHVSGEILNYEYLENMIEIARRHPDWFFWTYTKMYGLINVWCNLNGRENLPKNLSIMFSEWRGMKMSNPYNFPVFRCVFEDETPPADWWHCPGNCDVCKQLHRGCIKGENVWIHNHQ